jgi:hypothetical protein
MRRFAKRLTLASALVVLSSVAYSAGSYHKRTEPMFDHLVIAGVPHPPITLPKPPQIDLGVAVAVASVICRPTLAMVPGI